MQMTNILRLGESAVWSSRWSQWNIHYSDDLLSVITILAELFRVRYFSRACSRLLSLYLMTMTTDVISIIVEYRLATDTS